jgi:WbqC-like protein family
MKVGIMQPYFFPYLGYFSLIKHTDRFILFDPVQFIRHGWIERNRVLKQNEGWLYIQVPIQNKGRDVAISDLLIDNTQDWKKKILAQLQPYKKIAPNYFKVIKMLTEIFEKEYVTMVELNYETTKAICSYLKIDKDITVFSKMNLDIEEANAPDEWALNICKALGNVKEYWNPPGGQSFFDKSKYDEASIDLKFQSIKLVDYNQKRETFEPGLSIIDVLMFNSQEEVNQMLDNYQLL